MDKRVDEYEMSIEKKCMRILLKQQPVARDFREVSCALKMITDIERFGDQASDIGDLQPLDKPRGDQKAYAKLFERMLSEGYKGGKVRIDHCFNESGAKTLKKLILNKYPKADVTIDITYGLCSFYAENGGMLVGFEKI